MNTISRLTASVSIFPLEHILSRDDIECPGDKLLYECSVTSNSETVKLKWYISLFGQRVPVSIEYNSTSPLNITEDLSMSITSSLTNFTDGEYIESLLILELAKNNSLNWTLIECFSGDLDSDSLRIVTDSSGKVFQK